VADFVNLLGRGGWAQVSAQAQEGLPPDRSLPEYVAFDLWGHLLYQADFLQRWQSPSQ